MAQRRMFSLKVIDTDEFMDMPQTTQLLYYNLAMRADDDGFVANPKRIIKMTGSNDDDMKVLIAKKYVIPFESGICVIRHWRIHNYIQTDRYTQTEYLEELEKLALNSGKYEHKDKCIQIGYKKDTQVRLGKVRLGKVSNTPAKAEKDDSLDFKDLLEKYPDFRSFYELYPKKKDGRTALRAFKKLKPTAELLETILKDVAQKKISEDWQKENGRFVQHPATYLNKRLWEDEKNKTNNLKDEIYGYKK